MLIQCLINREGDTTVTRGGQNYVFRQNRQGHAVCEVQNDDHARLFLRMGQKYYRPYGAQAEAHAKRLKMVPELSVVEDEEESGEVFEEKVAITEGREGGAVTAAAGDEAGDEEPNEEVESAEEALAGMPEGTDEEVGLFVGTDEAGEGKETAKEGPQGDPLVRDVALRLLGQKMKKADVLDQLQKRFGLSHEEAKQTLSEVTQK